MGLAVTGRITLRSLAEGRSKLKDCLTGRSVAPASRRRDRIDEFDMCPIRTVSDNPVEKLQRPGTFTVLHAIQQLNLKSRNKDLCERLGPPRVHPLPFEDWRCSDSAGRHPVDFPL